MSRTKSGGIHTDANGVPIHVHLFPARAQSIAFGAVTSVGLSTTLGEDTVAVELFSPATTVFIKFGDTTSITAAVTDICVQPGTYRTYATKGMKYLAAIGGGANGGGTLRVTELT